MRSLWRRGCLFTGLRLRLWLVSEIRSIQISRVRCPTSDHDDDDDSGCV